MLNTIMLSVANKPLYAESNSAEYHYSECRYAECRGAIKQDDFHEIEENLEALFA
jgi:hypothetical protein